MTRPLTPIMRQYWSVKSKHPDKLVFFQMGDFFEMFYKDAEISAPILNIALTSRNKKDKDAVSMCGVPLHSMSKAAGQLLSHGYKVVICSQAAEGPSQKGLVERKIQQILSPGVAYDPSLLDELKAHYICAFDDQSISFADGATGEAFYYEYQDKKELQRLMTLLQPVEILFDETQRSLIPKELGSHLTLYQNKGPLLKKGPENLPESANRLLFYFEQMRQSQSSKILRAFEKRSIHKNCILSETLRKHLEITKTFEGENKGSLFSAVNRCQTYAGARRLKQYLLSPLADQPLIEKRLDQVESFFKDETRCQKVREKLKRLGDLQRRIGKIASPSVNARDLLSLGEAVLCAFELMRLDPDASPSLKEHEKILRSLAEGLCQDIRPEAPLSIKEGHLFNRGVDSKLDQLMEWSEHSKKILNQMELEEREKTRIPSLKIRSNQVFGFYIEITKTQAHKAPPHYFRKQTLSQAERYSTEELKKVEDKVLRARSERAEREYDLFCQRVEQTSALFPELDQLSRWAAALDVSSALAFLALERNYTRPVFSSALYLENSRHPVIEQERPFVPNTIELQPGQCFLLTGPNMAGKSTLMRQTALNVLLAQIGSFVPAERARLPIFKKIFTRIGSSDKLHSGLSTFMVEMTEVSEILRSAGPDSLIILDELGRGTSTYDGLSLAQAILEYMISKNKSYILFSTHYRELTRLKDEKIRQGYMAVQELDNTIDFLYTLRAGSCLRSYGIDVGEKARLPEAVIRRARKLLNHFENNEEQPIKPPFP